VSAPATGGRTVTLKLGAGPVMLTEYAAGGDAPVYVINADVAAARAYLGADSSVSPSNGVPLDPGTALPWSSADQLWAVADSAATAPITLTVTTAIADWTPSPAAIAAQVAARLLAQGIPNVLVETVIADNELVPIAGKKYAIGGYASLAISWDNNCGAFWRQNATNTATGVVVDSDTIAGMPDGFSPTQFRLEVVADQLEVIPTVNNAGHITIIGSNRPARRRADYRFATAAPDEWTTTGVAVGANLLNQSGGACIQGQAFASFRLPGGTAVRGYFYVQTPGSSHIQILMTTAEMVAASEAGMFGTKLVALPANYFVVFQATTGGALSSAIFVRFTDASP
jgi:hypothetical protein